MRSTVAPSKRLSRSCILGSVALLAGLGMSPSFAARDAGQLFEQQKQNNETLARRAAAAEQQKAVAGASAASTAAAGRLPNGAATDVSAAAKQ